MALGYVIVFLNENGKRELHQNAHGAAVYWTKSGAEKQKEKLAKNYKHYSVTSALKEHWQFMYEAYSEAEIVAIE